MLIDNLLYLSLALFLNFMAWRLATKAGYPGWAFLVLWVPFLNFFAVLYFVFAKWPVQEELDSCRARLTYLHQPTFLQQKQVLDASEESERADEDE